MSELDKLKLNSKQFSDSIKNTESNIEDIQKIGDTLKNGKIKRGTLVTLLQMQTSTRVSRTDISSVLDAIENFSKYHLK